MNANELADIVDKWAYKESAEYLTEAATMLRQQHEEIIKLKLEWQYMYDRANMESTNEPVAWMYQDDEGRSVAFYRDTLPCGAIPLYTHPVKELTDAEIMEMCHAYHYTYNPDYLGFARAILRKAQEQ